MSLADRLVFGCKNVSESLSQWDVKKEIQVGLYNEAVCNSSDQFGLFNTSFEILPGFQIGVINFIGGYLKGLQLGALNWVDSEISKGVQVGLICYASNGDYLQLGALTLRDVGPWYTRVTPFIGFHREG